MLLLLAFLTAVPSTMPLVDCPTACRRCRVNADPRDMMLVYCSMCEECRLKARKRRRGTRRNLEEGGAEDTIDVDTNAPGEGGEYKEYDEYDNPETALLVDREEYQPVQELGVEHPLGGQPLRHPDDSHYSDVLYDERENYYKTLDSLNIPEGCPTPPICDSDGDPPPSHRLTRSHPTTTTTQSTTTTTTTTAAPTTCPPIPPCIPKKHTTTRPPRRPTLPYDYPEPPYPPPCMYPYPCMPPCVMPMYPCQYPPPPIQPPSKLDQQISQSQTPPTEASTAIQKLKEVSNEMNPEPEEPNQAAQEKPEVFSDYTYVYLGVPKAMAAQI